MKKKLRFVIFSPPQFTSGGAIVLHLLCRLLSERGCNAKIFLSAVVLQKSSKIRFWRRLLINTTLFRVKLFANYILKCFNINHHKLVKISYSPIKVAHKYFPIIYKDTIVVYPEVVDGNPLGARRIVRWFLHQPGYHTGIISFGKNELCFAYQELFNNPNYNPQNNILQIKYIDMNLCSQYNFAERSGTCYIIRKGINREDLPNRFDGVVIDGMNQEDISKIFNRCKYCVSYDTMTFYSQMAAMCGCMSVVVPIPGVSKEQWQPIEHLRYGIAYGFDKSEIIYAQQTRRLLIKNAKEIDESNYKSLDFFVDECIRYFTAKQ